MSGSIPASPSVEAAGPAAAAAPRVAAQLSPTADAWRRFRKHRLAVMSLVVLALIVFGVLAGPLIWRVPIDAIDFSAMLQGPSWVHPCGADALGQDLLARLIYGGKISLAVGVAAMFVAVFVGMLIGAVSGMASGRLDAALMWVTDMFLALPQLPLLLLLIYLFRPALQRVLGLQGGIFVLIVVVIGGLRWMPLARLVRAQFLSLREKEFVEAARALGASRLRMVMRHIMPNALGPVIVAGTIEVANAIIAESTLSFLGVGFPPDVPSWGRMLYDAQDYLQIAPHWALFPGAAIFLAVLTINFIGDGLRDALDPRRVI
jgi:peptide/nickel transport system permease protein